MVLLRDQPGFRGIKKTEKESFIARQARYKRLRQEARLRKNIKTLAKPDRRTRAGSIVPARNGQGIAGTVGIGRREQKDSSGTGLPIEETAETRTYYDTVQTLLTTDGLLVIEYNNPHVLQFGATTETITLADEPVPVVAS